LRAVFYLLLDSVLLLGRLASFWRIYEHLYLNFSFVYLLTGYSSLSYLQSLPITALKIDCSFIKDIDTSSNSLEITSMIINLSNQLRLNVVAEGIQKDLHIDILKELCCEYGQGFLFSPPVDRVAATTLIATKVY
jgi:EAL domain-containing protein (putative c-di-GMP-specific phosphodiesterase class I)